MKNGLLKKMALLLAGVMVLGVTACGAEEQKEASKIPESSSVAESSSEVKESSVEPTPEPEKDYKDVEFRIGWWGSDARHNSTIAFIEEFEKDYKNLKVAVEYCGFGDYFNKLSTQAAGKQMPDVIQMDYAYLAQYAEAGLLLPLDEYVANGLMDMSNVAENTYMSGAINGELYAIPCGVNSNCYVYDKKVAAEAGVTIDKQMTWDEMLDAFKTVYEKTGKRGALPYVFDVSTRIFGEDLIAADGKSVAASPETLTTIMNAFYDGYSEGWLWNPVENPTDGMGDGFRNGEYWIYPIVTNQVGTVIAEAGEDCDLEMVGLPVVDDTVKPGFSKPSMLWAITSTCENPELAAEFINYYVNDARVYEIAKFDRAVPISNEIREIVKANATEDQIMQMEYMAWMEDGHSSQIFPPTPANWSEAWMHFVDEYEEKIDYMAVEPDKFEDIVNTAIEQANAILGATE